MSSFLNPNPTPGDELQPNEQEVDLKSLWMKIRCWVFGFIAFLLIVILGIWFYAYQQQQKLRLEDKAQATLIMAMDEQTVLSLIKDYPQTDAATQAMMSFAYRKFQQQDWKAARDYYQQAYDSKGGQRDELRAAALFGIAMTYEAEKNYAKSLETFSKLIEMFPKSYKMIEVKFRIGRLHELLGDYGKARQDYENIIVSYPDSQWKFDAENRLKIVKAFEGKPKK